MSDRRKIKLRLMNDWLENESPERGVLYHKWQSTVNRYRTQTRIRMREYRKRNPEKISAISKKHYNKYSDKYRAEKKETWKKIASDPVLKMKHRMYQRQYYKQRPNLAKERWQQKRNDPARLEQWKSWRKNYEGHRSKTDVGYVVRKRLSSRIRGAVIRVGKKCDKTTALIGCSIADFVKHIESLWGRGMSWQNQGLNGWHIDHKIPCANFDLSKPEEQKNCFHYSNLQPMWAKENRRKAASLTWQTNT